jgi:hypothetical protein
MKRFDAQKTYDDWEYEEFKALCSYAFGNFSSGVKLEDVDGHFEAGLDHLISLRAKVMESINRKLKDQS